MSRDTLHNNGPAREKACLRRCANNTGADQPAHPRSLISAFVIRLLESIISRLATDEISNFKLVSVAEETGLKLVLTGTPKTGFLATRPYYRGRKMTAVLNNLERLQRGGGAGGPNPTPTPGNSQSKRVPLHTGPDPLENYKVRKRAKIRNRYNQVPHLTQDTNGKVTNSQ